jgi:hypothetical protein
MAEYKLTPDVVTIVRGLLTTISKPKYPFTKPTLSNDAEYVVINSLPINADVMQKCYVNVNYHCKDINGGIGGGYVPDVAKLLIGANLIKTALKKVTSTNYLIDFDKEEMIAEEQEHYINLRFSFKYINK